MELRGADPASAQPQNVLARLWLSLLRLSPDATRYRLKPAYK